MKKKIAILFLLITIEIEIAFLVFWLWHCNNFQEVLHVHFEPLALQLKGEAGQDFGLPLFIIRLFHNKPVDAWLLTVKTYFRFWDFLFIGGLFPFIGSFGILVAGYSFFAAKTKRLWHWLLFILILALPFMELFLYAKIPFLIRTILFYIIFGLISLLGIRKFALSQKWGWLIILILTVVSVWYFAVADFHIGTFCYQYP